VSCGCELGGLAAGVELKAVEACCPWALRSSWGAMDCSAEGECSLDCVWHEAHASDPGTGPARWRQKRQGACGNLARARGERCARG
jgi:hypothetical protein